MMGNRAAAFPNVEEIAKAIGGTGAIASLQPQSYS